MSEETKPEGAPETATETAPEPPTDFREFVKWRQTGELPARETSPAAVETPAKTVPPSGAEETSVAVDDEEPGEKPGRGSSRVRKIDRLTKENLMLREQLASITRYAKPGPPEPPEPPKPAEPAGKPKLHDYQTLEAYQEALTDYKIDQREAQKKAEAAQAEAKSAEEKIQLNWSKSQDSARTVHPDYDEVLQSVPVPEGPGVLAARQALLEEEAGAEILYHLATHPEELKRIAQLAPVSAIREIGRLGATFASSSPAPGKAKPIISGAPRPPAPLSRPSAGVAKKDILDEDFARNDFRAWSKAREAQLKGQ